VPKQSQIGQKKKKHSVISNQEFLKAESLKQKGGKNERKIS